MQSFACGYLCDLFEFLGVVSRMLLGPEKGVGNIYTQFRESGGSNCPPHRQNLRVKPLGAPASRRLFLCSCRRDAQNAAWFSQRKRVLWSASASCRFPKIYRRGILRRLRRGYNGEEDESPMKIITLPALSDNYIFLLLNEPAQEAAVVDPGEAGPVRKYLQKSGLRLTAILNTHHHSDHTGGNKELLKQFPGILVCGGAGDRGRIPGQSAFLREGNEIEICGAKAHVLEVPGHTKGHIAYFFADGDGGDLFSGDTVFGGTIGNMFEGTPEVMFESIRKIRALPRRTRIWCSHEYTLQFVRESAGLDPHNARLAKRLKDLEASASSGNPTVPLLLEEECATNPFFRWDAPDLNSYFSKEPGIATFRHLCQIT
jgi:hydroxyacylglutathione hydrolase